MKKAGTLLILVLTIFFIWKLYSYLNYRYENAVSDAAFVKSDAIYRVSFKVGGKIEKLYKNEGDRVKKGEVLAKIDPTDLNIAKDELAHTINSLQAKYNALKQKRERLYQELGIKSDISKNNISVSDSKEEALRYKVKSLEANLQKLSKDQARYQKLLRQKLISASDFESIDTKYKSLKEQVQSAQKELDSYIKSIQNVKFSHHLSKLEETQVKELDFSLKSLEESIKASQDRLKALNNKITYTALISPIEGVIAKRFINPGSVVEQGTPIYAVVDTNNKHVEVLLSEKKLEGVKVGNSVKITTDANDKAYKGEVESILPTSASTFSLVPRDIASGEFTKLDQRFIVRIALKEDQDQLKDLLIGMGATVAIQRSK